MDTTLTSKGYRIPLEGNEGHMKKLVIFSQTPGDYPGPRKRLVCWRRDEKFLYLPKQYAINHFGPPRRRSKEVHESISVKFDGQLREAQKEVIDKTIKVMEERGGGLWAISVGFGKTICALHLIAKMGVKALVIVHKQVLMDQWRERIQQFIPEARIGKIQGPVTDIENKDIVVAMIQSLTRKEYPKSIFKSFALLLVDECHCICSKTFSDVLFMIQPKYRLGLSATPKRKDGFDKIFEYHLGEIIVKIDNTLLKPIIKVIHANFPQQVFLNQQQRTNLPRLITDISSNKDRNEFIIKTIEETMKESRKMLVFSDRVQQCKQLVKMFSVEGKKAETFIGEKKNEELKEALKADVIVATYGICKEGFDCPSLDTLLFATPKSDVIQAVGRILRKKNKYEPLVIDIVDKPVDVLSRSYWCRKRWYKNMNFPIEEPKKISIRNSTFLY